MKKLNCNSYHWQNTAHNNTIQFLIGFSALNDIIYIIFVVRCRSCVRHIPLFLLFFAIKVITASSHSTYLYVLCTSGQITKSNDFFCSFLRWVISFRKRKRVFNAAKQHVCVHMIQWSQYYISGVIYFDDGSTCPNMNQLPHAYSRSKPFLDWMTCFVQQFHVDKCQFRLFFLPFLSLLLCVFWCLLWAKYWDWKPTVCSIINLRHNIV